MSDTSHSPNVIYIQHSEPRHIHELQNLIMGARFSFHVWVSDRGLLEQNAWIHQTKRGQLNTQQMQRANKSNCILSADCRAHRRFSAVFHGHEREFPCDENAKQGADNSQTPGQMLMLVPPIKQTTQVTCDGPLADSTRETLPDSWIRGKVKFWWRTSTEISGFSINYIRWQVWFPQKVWQDGSWARYLNVSVKYRERPLNPQNFKMCISFSENCRVGFVCFRSSTKKYTWFS